jgi:hypothetical protein
MVLVIPALGLDMSCQLWAFWALELQLHSYYSLSSLHGTIIGSTNDPLRCLVYSMEETEKLLLISYEMQLGTLQTQQKRAELHLLCPKALSTNKKCRQSFKVSDKDVTLS